MDGDTEKQIYIPEFQDNGDGTFNVKVGGTTYILPTNTGGGCTCNWSLTQDGSGKWTVSDGTNSAVIPTVPTWVDAVTVSHNGTNFEIASTTDPTQKVTIPNGYADLSIDENGVATVTSADGTKSIQLQKTQPVVEAVGKDSVLITNYDLTGKELEKYYMPSAGAFADMTKTVNGIKTDVDKLKAQVGDWDETKGSITDSIAGIDKRITDLQKEVNSLFEKMLQALASMITNIQVEEVMSNAIGSYNGVLTNIKTTKLVGYFGKFQNTVRFPSDVAGGENIKAGTVSDTLGTIQLTVNPIGTDFSANGGVAVSLVNSNGDESSIKLTNLASSDKTLMTGITRAAGTGLYETKAYIAATDIYDSRLQMAIDMSAVKKAVTDTYNDLKNRDIKVNTVNEVANAIYNVVNGISTERLAVKTSYTYETTDLNGNKITSTKSVVSPYDLSGVMVAPLGFESLPEQYRDSLRVFNKAKSLLKRANTRIAKKIISTIEEYSNLSTIEQQISDLQIKVKKVKPIPESMKVIKTVVDIDTTVTVTVPIDKDVPINIDTNIGIDIPVEVTYEYDLPENFRMVDDPEHPGEKIIVYDKTHKTEKTTVEVKDNVHFVYTDNIKIKEDIKTDVEFWIKKEFAIDISDMVDQVNDALDVVASVDDLCESANSIINNIYKLEDKLLAGNYLNRINKYIDKASHYSAKGLYKLFQPVLLVNSDSGFGFAGLRGVPATVSGTVEVIPTTYSNGIVAPVYKKFISVNGTPVKGSNGKNVHNDAVLDITSYLQTGENVIEYYALDYHGNESHGEYIIIKK